MKSDPANSEPKTSKTASPFFQIFILTLATFMAILDSTVANVALPKMSGSLGVSPNEVIWVVSSYIVANAAILPISGWLATYLGRKRYYMICVFCFTVSSVLCGLATNLETLVVFRIFQGLSAGGLAPTEQAIIADITPRDKLGRAFSIYALGISLAPIFGPTLGGYITDTLSWHWIFFINIPIGMISLLLTYLFVNETEQAIKATEKLRREGRGIDWVGILLFITGIAAFELVMDKGTEQGWLESDFILLMASYSFLSLLIGCTWEYYRDSPAVNIMLFRDKAFTGAIVLIFAGSFVVAGTVFLVPYMTQILLGYTAMDAGMVGLPATIVQLIMFQVAGYLADKYDIRKVIFLGLFLTFLANVYFTTFNLNVSFYDIALGRVFMTFGLGFIGTTVNTAAYYSIKPENNNDASAMLNLARNMGMSLGVALTSTFLVLRTKVYTANFNDHFSALNSNFTRAIEQLAQNFKYQGLNSDQAIGAANSVYQQILIKQATMNAILDAFYIYAFLFILVMPCVFLLKSKKETENIGGH
ncbi:MAG: DHA2 family efflux MFS transporter permease subunit [Pyrinomonadaceae bacterium]